MQCAGGGGSGRRHGRCQRDTTTVSRAVASDRANALEPVAGEVASPRAATRRRRRTISRWSAGPGGVYFLAASLSRTGKGACLTF